MERVPFIAAVAVIFTFAATIHQSQAFQQPLSWTVASPGTSAAVASIIAPPSLSPINIQSPQGTVFQFTCTTADSSPCINKNWSFAGYPSFLTPSENAIGGALTTNQPPPLPSTSLGSLTVTACDSSEPGCVVQAPPTGNAPCDIYAGNGYPCVTAHSTVRALYSSYNGPLYQIRRASDSALLDVGLLSAGGIANAAQHDSFCAGTSCQFTIIYDQSPNNNNLSAVVSSAGSWPAGTMPITIAGHKAYGVYVSGQYVNSFSDRGAVGTPGSDAPGTNCTVVRCAEEVYMVSTGLSQYTTGGSGTFDYGSAEDQQIARGAGTIHALSWGRLCWVYEGCNLQGTGPWLAIDLEGAVFYSDTGVEKDPSDTGLTSPFVTLISSVDGVATFNRKGASAQGGTLTTWYSGPNPIVDASIFQPTTPCPTCYTPLRLEGGVILGTGGDGVSGQAGVFFEGAIVRGRPPDTVDNLIQTNVIAAGYTSIP